MIATSNRLLLTIQHRKRAHTTDSPEIGSGSVTMEPGMSPPALCVMQWNLLADGLAQFGDFVRVPSETLEWNSRAPKLLSGVLEADADIVCLQELNHYDDFWLPQLQQHGYDGTFVPKKWSPASKYGYPSDGCAIFTRASRLQILKKEVIPLPGLGRNATNQSAIVCHLEDLTADREFIVATAHFKAKSGEENVKLRLAQARTLMDMLTTWTQDSPRPCVVCGDFNAPPTSEVYKFVHEHELGLQSVYACKREFPSGEKSSYVKLDSAVDGGATWEPPYTTWKFRSTGEKKETIDYIWISKKILKASRCRSMPSEESIGVNALPTESFPSDHLPLLCELLWQEDQPHPCVPADSSS